MTLADIEGLFVGALNPEELEFFNAEVAAGRAMRSYEGVGGLMGVAKVRRVKCQV